jgi:hypothetical protein
MHSIQIQKNSNSSIHIHDFFEMEKNGTKLKKNHCWKKFALFEGTEIPHLMQLFSCGRVLFDKREPLKSLKKASVY